MMRLPDPPMLLVTDRAQARRPLTEIVGAALSGGCRWVSLREKDLPEDEQVVLARMLIAMARKHGARLMLHGEAALAEVAGVDGVHLPSGSDAAAARTLLGPDKLIGVSLHTVTEAASDRSASSRLRAGGTCLRDAEQAGLRPRNRPQGT